MSSLMVRALLVFLLMAGAAFGQTFQQCADVNQNSTVNISDMVAMYAALLDIGPPIPAGKGDIDFRQNFNLGDLRYLTGYLFWVYPEGGCPPFSAYTIQATNDSLFLPSRQVQPGSGQLTLPIVMVNQNPLTDLVLFLELKAVDATAQVDSVVLRNWDPQPATSSHQSNQASILWSIFDLSERLNPGAHAIAEVFVSYSSAVGGTITLDSATFSTYRFPHEVYGNAVSGDYSVLQIGKPAIIVGVDPGIPSLVVAPDSLSFVALHGSPAPEPQSFTIDSDGAPFGWSLTHPTWLSVTPSVGLSGATVSVQPILTGLAPGIYNGTIEVASATTLNSPQSVSVRLQLQAQYPAFDANCDGNFSIADIVVLVMYIFGGPAPCNPCGAR